MLSSYLTLTFVFHDLIICIYIIRRVVTKHVPGVHMFMSGDPLPDGGEGAESEERGEAYSVKDAWKLQ